MTRPGAEEARDCPDCEQGKHRNCRGTGWNNALDMLVDCPCEVRGHGA